MDIVMVEPPDKKQASSTPSPQQDGLGTPITTINRELKSQNRTPGKDKDWVRLTWAFAEARNHGKRLLIATQQSKRHALRNATPQEGAADPRETSGKTAASADMVVVPRPQVVGRRAGAALAEADERLARCSHAGPPCATEPFACRNPDLEETRPEGLLRAGRGQKPDYDSMRRGGRGMKNAPGAPPSEWVFPSRECMLDDAWELLPHAPDMSRDDCLVGSDLASEDGAWVKLD